MAESIYDEQLISKLDKLLLKPETLNRVSGGTIISRNNDIVHFDDFSLFHSLFHSLFYSNSQFNYLFHHNLSCQCSTRLRINRKFFWSTGARQHRNVHLCM